jgi:hypothetical protein
MAHIIKGVLTKDNYIAEQYPGGQTDHYYLVWVDSSQNIIMQSTMSRTIKIIDVYNEKVVNVDMVELDDISNYQVLTLPSIRIIKRWNNRDHGVLVCTVRYICDNIW